MILIADKITGAAIAFILGVLIAAGNYFFSRHMLKKRPENYASTQMVRQLLQIAYLVVLFFVGPYTPWDRNWMLVGGCLGITLPMFFFTYKLVKLNESSKRKEDHSDG